MVALTREFLDLLLHLDADPCQLSLSSEPDAKGIDRIWQHWSIKPLLNLSSTDSLVIFSTRFSTLVDNSCLFFLFLSVPHFFLFIFQLFSFLLFVFHTFTFFDLLSSASVFLCHFCCFGCSCFLFCLLWFNR